LVKFRHVEDLIWV
jgi:hypothetical protein